VVNCRAESGDSKPEVNVVKMPLSSDEQITQALQSCNYINVDKTKQDVLEALEKFKGLEAELNQFAFNNGTQVMLLTLTGTIPVEAEEYEKGKIYNIPVVIWLPIDYPDRVPELHLKHQPASREYPFDLDDFAPVDQEGRVWISRCEYINKYRCINVLITLINYVINDGGLRYIELSKGLAPGESFFDPPTAPDTTYLGMYA